MGWGFQLGSVKEPEKQTIFFFFALVASSLLKIMAIDRFFSARKGAAISKIVVFRP